MDIKIRFNTNKDKVDNYLPPWRVIIDGKEYLAEKVTIQTTSWTTYDEIAPGQFKWHISCSGRPEWNEYKKECIIVSA